MNRAVNNFLLCKFQHIGKQSFLLEPFTEKQFISLWFSLCTYAATRDGETARFKELKYTQWSSFDDVFNKNFRSRSCCAGKSLWANETSIGGRCFCGFLQAAENWKGINKKDFKAMLFSALISNLPPQSISRSHSLLTKTRSIIWGISLNYILHSLTRQFNKHSSTFRFWGFIQTSKACNLKQVPFCRRRTEKKNPFSEASNSSVIIVTHVETLKERTFSDLF